MVEEEKKVEQTKEKKKGFWDAIPAKTKLLSVIILVAAFIFGVNLFLAILGVSALLFFSQDEWNVEDEIVLTPEEAYEIVLDKIDYLKEKQLVARDVRYIISENYSLVHSSLVPKAYYFGVRFMFNSGRNVNKIMKVIASGPTRGFCLVRDGIGRFRGDEEPDKRDVLPMFFDKMKEYKLDKYFLNK